MRLSVFQCSVTCGEGVQQRDVYCRLRGSGRVNEETCNHLTRPPSKRLCDLVACEQYQWLTDEWQDVSTPLGFWLRLYKPDENINRFHLKGYKDCLNLSNCTS